MLCKKIFNTKCWGDCVGRSVVLKDLKGRPQGYLREAQSGILCRAALNEPAELLIAFDDGTQEACALEPGRNEQLLAFRDRCFCSGCVFRDSELLLLTDDAARQMYHARMARVCRKKKTDDKTENLQAGEKTDACQVPAESERDARQKNGFPARRWPPPVCWDTASYECGRWCEAIKPSV